MKPFASAQEHPRRGAARPAIFLLLALLCIAATIAHLGSSFALASWHKLLLGGPSADMRAAILYYSALPRLAVALLAGAGLGLASAVLQIVLRNPIAEPATLGISGGASLALAATALWSPALLDEARTPVAFLGGGTSMLLVVGLALGRGLSSSRLILGGLIVSLLCGVLNALLALFHHDTLQGIFIWNAGSLVQNDWHTAKLLSIECIASSILFMLLVRGLTVLQLEDESARSLGLSLPLVRLAALIGALLVSASVASAVGVVGFVGLAATTLARASGVRSPMGRLIASPEVLGVSSGAAIGALLSIFTVAQPERLTMTGFAGLGAAVTLGLVFAFARRAQFSPEHMLLAGISVSTLFTGVITFLLATGDPRLRIFMGWMAGSISRATIDDAFTAAILALLAAAAVPLLRRWLDILPMGSATAHAVGLDGGRSRSLLLLVIAVLTAAPTMLVGPLSFVGLMAPHMVRMAGIERPIGQCVAAGAMGAIIILAADVAGRTMLFPYEIPAGLMASLIGAPYFLWSMRKN